MFLDLPLTLLAIGTVSIAAYTDLHGELVPDELALPMIAAGVAVHVAHGAFRGDVLLAALGFAGAGVGFGLCYPLYLFGGFGGGDVKLLAAIGALLPTTPPSVVTLAVPAFTSVPLFPLTVLVDGLLLSSPLIGGYALLCLARGESVSAKKVPVPDLELGMVPAEAVWESGGKVGRGSSLPESYGRCYADPLDTGGLKDHQIEGLLRQWRGGGFGGSLEIKRTFPFAPVLTAGTFAAVLFGNLYWAILACL